MIRRLRNWMMKRLGRFSEYPLIDLPGDLPRSEGFEELMHDLSHAPYGADRFVEVYIRHD